MIDGGSGLVFEILPDVLASGRDTDSYGRSSSPYTSLASTTSGNISVELGNHNIPYRSSGMYVSFTPVPAVPPENYIVWIDYDGKSQIIWVYVDKGNKPKPAEATLPALNISGIFTWNSIYGCYFGLFASKDRRMPSGQPVIYSWSLTVDRLSKPIATAPRGIGRGWFVAIVVSSVLVVAVAGMVLFFRISIAAVARGLASRYQALKMKLKLSRALRRLPGVPREFKYTDVKKATRNFHESLRLGRGGFGAVYKGTVTIAISTSTGHGEDGPRQRRCVDVAVKKFTRKDCGYEDFLAEVAVINRLRHKNIVPLIGTLHLVHLLRFQFIVVGTHQS
ncbi:hypothetical protein ACP4OV_010280 [Aristida adscensionis]